MNLSLLREKANNLPFDPGVYIMKDSSGNVIYVGKAKKLKNRVTSYFHGEHLPKVEAMIEKIDDFEIIVVKSEFEALILESSLIKKYQPHYNILLKDDKGFPFVRINLNDDYPDITIASKPQKDNAEYFGPFGGRGTTRVIIESIREALKLPSCNRQFPSCIGRGRPCINFTMKVCDGWCIKDNNNEYRKRINQAVMILDGNSKELVEDLTSKMYKASDDQNFELAAVLRDRIKSVEGLSNKQRVTKKGSSRYFVSQKTEDNSQKYKKQLAILDDLKNMLGLSSVPRRIEAFDVSNLGDSGIVAAMTVFYEGKPYKKDYRKFRIRDCSGRDDYSSMYQSVYRRFRHYCENDIKFGVLPDLLLIDGGANHAAVAEKALSELGLSVPVFGMVKDSHHKTRALINSEAEEISISGDIAIFSLIGRIQDETHRFAVEYQRTVRYEGLGSVLDEIKGIGPKRKADLIKNFKSVKAIKLAEEREIADVIGISAAHNVYCYFHGDFK